MKIHVGSRSQVLFNSRLRSITRYCMRGTATTVGDAAEQRSKSGCGPGFKRPRAKLVNGRAMATEILEEVKSIRHLGLEIMHIKKFLVGSTRFSVAEPSSSCLVAFEGGESPVTAGRRTSTCLNVMTGAGPAAGDLSPPGSARSGSYAREEGNRPGARSDHGRRAP